VSDSSDNINERINQIYLSFERKAHFLTKNDLQKAGEIVQKDLQDYGKNKGWKDIPNHILSRMIDDNTVEIYGSNEKRTIMKYLNFGTKAHFIKPVRAKVLSWVQGGERFFSKGHMVSGIKAMNFFRITESARSKVLNFVSERRKAAFNN